MTCSVVLRAIVLQCLLQELLLNLQQVLLVVGYVCLRCKEWVAFIFYANIVKTVRPMTFVMKQTNFLESEITFSKSWLTKQASLLRRSVHSTMKCMEINEFL